MSDTAEGGGDYVPPWLMFMNDYCIKDCIVDNGLPEVTVALCASALET